MKNFSLLLFSLALWASLPIKGQEKTLPAIVIHGGAGTIERGMLSDSLESEIRASLQKALDQGYALLEQGASSMEAVVLAISILEDSHHFNAGKGAVMTREGSHELDASIMRGSDLQAGAISGVTNIKNPIKGALAVLNASPHVMLYGKGAERFASSQGLVQVPNNYFTTPRIRSSWERSNAKGREHRRDGPKKFGTVGAVAIDAEGRIAAGTSTGGIMNKENGRIGDSPIIGAGTYADDATCGISCTGQGEFFIRIGVAKEISDQMKFANKSLGEAAQYTLGSLTEMGALGGLIGLDRKGGVVMDFNTPGMYRGYKNQAVTKVDIYGND